MLFRDSLLQTSSLASKSSISSRQSIYILALSLVLISFVTYLPSIHNGFVWDAEIFIADNPAIQDLSQLTRVFSQASVVDHNESDQVAQLQYYRPLNTAFHILSYAAFGDQPLGYKLSNIILHTGVCLLAFLLFLSVSRNALLAALAALLFSVKPTHVEAVAWTYSASYLLTAFFALGAILLYRHGPRWLALIVFSGALLFNEMGVLLLPLLLLHRWLLEHARYPRDFVPLLPYAAIALIFLVLRTAIVGAVPLSSVDPLTFLNTSAVILQRYVKIFFWPDAPVTIYLAQTFTSFSAEVILSYLVSLTLGGLAVFFWFRDRVSLFWLLWFCCWIGVSFNIGQFGDYLMAEKLVYIASIGPSMLLVNGLYRISKQNRQWVAAITIGASLILAAETWSRLPYWKDTASYLQAALRFAPSFDSGHYALANAYIQRKNYDQAQYHLEKSIALRPDFSLALNNLANIHYLKQDRIQAIIYWQRAVALDPSNPLPHFNIGMTLQQQGKIEEASQYFRRYFALEPDPQPGASRAVLQRLSQP